MVPIWIKTPTLCSNLFHLRSRAIVYVSQQLISLSIYIATEKHFCTTGLGVTLHIEMNFLGYPKKFFRKSFEENENVWENSFFSLLNV